MDGKVNGGSQSILVPTDLAQAIVDYLKRQPFEDVHNLVVNLIKCPLALEKDESIGK